MGNACYENSFPFLCMAKEGDQDQHQLQIKQSRKGFIFVSLILSLYNEKEKCLNNGKTGKVTKKRRCDNHD
ncbi:hypothetical protein NCCP28_09930 [Niallia sp. NCCP-28]|nr:hypothetical protein NCCP28_09930 [Niallia sp. NCCP-28]